MLTTSFQIADGRTVSIIHYSDYGGDCHIVITGPNDVVGHEVTVPCEVLLQFAAGYVRDTRIDALEQPEWETVLAEPHVTMRVQQTMESAKRLSRQRLEPLVAKKNGRDGIGFQLLDAVDPHADSPGTPTTREKKTGTS